MTANPPTQCPSAALKFAGDCPHCNKVFCSVHRTPETHNCSGMQACRDAAFQANKERLERERTVASKIAQA
ncbi:nucleus protein [Trichosporon asahii var. asahii CBS 8904]|uniref:Nucleus protein n=2 Tax=Trichosporon asahii var. asahii TaxID=189963 RepID=K1VLL5_TRIAC|nr:nucleus protein [Trichosporon asahii var. asahii CBS 2479]EJT45484.1 nucleus protein [Trichosporon asahii var. asahii CBS 2479]EKD00187.1 nucleus protein [Trichosporon asahii var. asahii CBS 8904]